MTVAPLGTIYIARATLFNSAGKLIGYCTDTPNAIAKAFMEHHKATAVKEYLSDIARCRTEYTNRMNQFNTCESNFISKQHRAERHD